MGKVYAVRKGKRTGIFYDWDETKAAVDGFPGAEFKSFKNETEAKAYLGKEFVPTTGSDTVIKKPVSVKEPVRGDDPNLDDIIPLTDAKVVAYTDGSYNGATGTAGYGVVLLNGDGDILDKISGEVTSKSNQVDGELFAVITAIMYAIKKGATSVEIRYDYTGVEQWATGKWKAEKAVSREYMNVIRAVSDSIKLIFRKVDAHTGVFYNEMADELAKKGCGAE